MSLPRSWRSSPAAAILGRDRCVLVDIGAREGLPLHWEAVGSLIDVLAFEPDEVEAKRLTAQYQAAGAAVTVRSEAVWSGAGRQVLQLTKAPGCSSLYEPRHEFLSEFPEAGRFEVHRTVEVDTVTLDDAVAQSGSRSVRFVKIDAQGGALPILMGASTVLGTAVGLEVEVEFAPMYSGEPLFGEVDAHLRSQGFELVDLRPTYWRRHAARHAAGTRGQLIFADALYMLAPRELAARVTRLTPDAVQQVSASTILACSVYGLSDWMMAYAAALEPVAREGAALIRAQLQRMGKRAGPRVPLAYPLGLWLKDLGDRLIETPHTWAVAEQRLGSKSRFGFLSRLRRRLRRRAVSRQ